MYNLQLFLEQVVVGVMTKTVTVKHTATVDRRVLVARLNEAHLEASLEPFRQAKGIKYGWIPKWNGEHFSSALQQISMVCQQAVPDVKFI